MTPLLSSVATPDLSPTYDRTMSGPVDVAATSAYLHRVMNRCTDAAFGSDVDLDDIAVPQGIELTLRGDGEGGRLLDGTVRFDPPLAATDAAALFERVVTLPDDSIRVLLPAPEDHPWSRVGPTRVTLAFPMRPNTSAPVREARMVFPDRFTSPTGQVIGTEHPDSADLLNTWIDALTPVTDDGFDDPSCATAYELLVAAVREGTALEMQAAYAAMIAPLRAMGRDETADRCAAIISAAAPMCHEVEGMRWSGPRTKELVAYDVRGLIEPGSTLRIDVDGAKIVVDTMAMRPLRLSSLPAGTALELFESGTIEPAPGGGFVSRHGKPVIGAVVKGHLVVGSVWELPPGPGVSVEAVVDWSD